MHDCGAVGRESIRRKIANSQCQYLPRAQPDKKKGRGEGEGGGKKKKRREVAPATINDVMPR